MNKHLVKKILLSLLIIFSLYACSARERVSKGSYRNTFKSYQDAFSAFDTECSVTLYGDMDSDEASKYMKEIRDIASTYEKIFSKTDSESELYKLNHRTSSELTISNELADLLDVGKEMYNWSMGYFDISSGKLIDLWDIKNRKTLPDEKDIEEAIKYNGNFDYKIVKVDNEDQSKIIFDSDKGSTYDFGALAKGYVSDRIRQMLIDNKKIEAAIINLGGNVCCYGEQKERENGMFVVGIFKPFSDGELIDKVSVKDKCVITSGNYQRYFKIPGDEHIYHHIINPKLGYPIDNGIDSVTIISENGLLGDYLSTACMLLGEKYGNELIDGCKKEFDDENIEAIFIHSDGEIVKY